MYVIFPADEIVYLSYGRVLYVPPHPTSENQVAALPPQPLRSSLSTESHASYLSRPSTSTNSSTKSHVSGASCFRSNGLDTSSYPPSPGEQTCSDNKADPPVRPKRKKESLFRFSSLLQSKSKVPEIERKSSFSDFFKIGRDKRNTSPAIVAPSQIQNTDYRFTRDQTAVTFQLAETDLQKNFRENTPKEQRKETCLRTKPTNCTPPDKSPNLVVRNTENKTVFDFSQPSTSKSYLDPLSHKINIPNNSPDNTSNKSADLTTPKTPNTKPKRKISSEKSPPIRTRSEKSPQKTIREKIPSDKTSYRVRSRSCNSDKSSLSKSFSEKVSCIDKSSEPLREKTPPTNSSREKSPPGRIFSDRKQLSNSLYQKPTTKSLKKTRLNKSFRDKLTVGKDKTPSPQIGQSTRNISGPVNFDSLFAREPSPAKLSLIIPPRLETEAGSRTSFRQTQEKQTPTRERTSSGKAKAKKSILKPQAIMAANESALRDLLHPGYNEQLKSHNAVTFKLVRTVSDFTQQLGQMYEQHAEELQLLVSNFRKKNGELRKERPACPSSLFHTWETLLQEVEIDSQALGEIASILGRQVSRPLLERSFHRKIQSRKVFSHRESYETIISKTEEKLAKCRQEYKTAYLSYLAAPSTESLSCYFKTHNSYVQQLHATNGMLEEYGKDTLPNLLQELEEIYSDICSTITDSVLQGAEVVSARAMEQCKRYEGLVTQCKSVAGGSDLIHLARSLPVPPGRGLIMKRPFVPPQPPPPVENVDGEINETPNENVPPPLKDELVVDRLSAVQLKPSHDALRKEAGDLETQIRQIHDALDTLVRMQQRSVEASLYNKANEIQEDISLKRFDLRVAKIHLSAIHAQKELFSSKLEGDVVRERKLSTASTASMKNKWLKAFKSLKTPPPETEKKNGAAATRELLKGDPDAHNFQENTYKKITPCDVCSQILRGHTRQGLRCRICKMNVHLDCQNKASKCQTKARLLRRQKSTSEIETRVPDTTLEEERKDKTYSGMPTINRRLSIRDTNRLYPPMNSILDPRHVQVASSSESSSMRRRLFAGMKSLTGFGSRSRQGSPGHRSISLPEKRNSQDASGTRPFGQPLLIGPHIENGNGLESLPPTPPSPSPSKGKPVPPKRGLKSKK